jgi:hypothetical protein
VKAQQLDGNHYAFNKQAFAEALVVLQRALQEPCHAATAARITQEVVARRYIPDFVVETKSAKYLCEPKLGNEMNDETVQAKARAIVTWCDYATSHAQTNGGKPWYCQFASDAAIRENMTLQSLAEYLPC